MIQRVCIDNYKCLVDFSWAPKEETLVLGVNGSGKTAVLDAIDSIRSWTLGRVGLDKWLDARLLTRWYGHRAGAKFEIDILTSERLYRYSVEVEVSGDPKAARVTSEKLSSEGINRDDRAAELFDLRRKGENVEIKAGGRATEYRVPSAFSAIATLQGAHSMAARPFMDALHGLIAVRPFPESMEGESKLNDPNPDKRFSNFVAWYRAWALESHEFEAELNNYLAGIWEGFSRLMLVPVGENTEILRLVFQSNRQEENLLVDFKELSDGERMIVVLYGLAAFQRTAPPRVIMIDEPDNFLALSELQPWLLEMLDGRPEGGQLILISHNAEMIEAMGKERVVVFERANHAHRTTARDVGDNGDALSLSELFARGWLKTNPASRERSA